ncbi:MAG: hypothetical protein KAV87_22435 [Desulfobacteraceae bacterium]|nr:hypothetical protein [Desulfobacteraceae bacterium]
MSKDKQIFIERTDNFTVKTESCDNLKHIINKAEKLIASLEPFRNNRLDDPDKTLLLESLEFLLSFISFHGPNCPVVQKGPGYEVYHGTAIELLESAVNNKISIGWI